MKDLFTLDIKNYLPQWNKEKRDSSRGIIMAKGKKVLPFSPDDKISLVFAKNQGYYKFPGGGIHADEDRIDALIREVSEETGLSVIRKSIKEFGKVKRFQKSTHSECTIFEQESFYYFVDVDDKIHEQNLDSYEMDAGFELRTVTIKEAVSTNMQYKSKDSFDLLMIARDTSILQLLIGNKPEPSKQFAHFLLNEGASLNPGPWKLHSIEVAESAEKIAKAVVKNGGNLNSDKAYVYGLLHDIDRRFGVTYLAHVIDGYDYLSAMGFENAARICITHSFNLQTIEDYIGKKDVSDNQLEKIQSLLDSYEYDDYDRLIQLLDSTCNADGTKNLEKRMEDVKNRYGYYPKAKYDKNFELKAYFEKLMGKDFYTVLQ